MGERVAVDREQRSTHSDASSSRIAAISRSVVSTGSSDVSIGAPYRTCQRSRRRSPFVPLMPAGNERHARVDRDPRRARVRLRLVLLAQPFPPARALREHRDHVAVARELHRGVDRLAVGAAAVHLERAARR